MKRWGSECFLRQQVTPPPLPTLPAPLNPDSPHSTCLPGKDSVPQLSPRAAAWCAQWQRLLLPGSRRGSLGPLGRREAGLGTLPLSVFCLLEWSQH